MPSAVGGGLGPVDGCCTLGASAPPLMQLQLALWHPLSHVLWVCVRLNAGELVPQASRTALALQHKHAYQRKHAYQDKHAYQWVGIRPGAPPTHLPGQWGLTCPESDVETWCVAGFALVECLALHAGASGPDGSWRPVSSAGVCTLSSVCTTIRDLVFYLLSFLGWMTVVGRSRGWHAGLFSPMNVP
jgi:hypothetical protein